MLHVECVQKIDTHGSQASMSKNYDKSGFVKDFKRFVKREMNSCRLIDAANNFVVDFNDRFFCGVASADNKKAERARFE